MSLGRPATRIISLTPSLTAFVAAIGAADRLVGVTEFCTVARGCTPQRIGGGRNPDHAAIAALQPDLILATAQENTAADLRALAASGAVVQTFSIRFVADLPDQLGELAALLGCSAAAAPLLDELRDTIAAAIAAQSEQPARRALVFTSRDPWIAVGGESYADDLLRLCGADNLAQRLGPRTPRATLEAFVQYNPQVIILAGWPAPFADADRAAFQRFGDVAAVLFRRIRLCDGALFAHYGVRTAEAIRTLRMLIQG
jgi:ABC-type Fe3+-hydroxamate transport system substrate-binding protein